MDLYSTNVQKLTNLLRNLLSDADLPSWTASDYFFDSYYDGSTKPFTDSFFGPLVYLITNSHTCSNPLLLFMDFMMHIMLLMFFNQMVKCEGGGNTPAVAVPLVAVGTQNGTIDLIDVSSNAVASSFSVHKGTVRGLRWLGNSRLVSFSYSQVFCIFFWRMKYFCYFNADCRISFLLLLN